MGGLLIVTAQAILVSCVACRRLAGKIAQNMPDIDVTWHAKKAKILTKQPGTEDQFDRYQPGDNKTNVAASDPIRLQMSVKFERVFIVNSQRGILLFLLQKAIADHEHLNI